MTNAPERLACLWKKGLPSDYVRKEGGVRLTSPRLIASIGEQKLRIVVIISSGNNKNLHGGINE